MVENTVDGIIEVMNVYDFDKTIFYPDSTVSFIKWCLLRYPMLWVCYIPKSAFIGILYFLKLYPVTKTEEQLVSFLKYIPDIDKEVKAFWEKNEKRIADWYLKQKKSDDLIISAAPEFFLKPIAEKLQVQLIGSQIDKKTGKITGHSCYGREKVKYIISSDYFPKNQIDEFYSDSLTDAPLAYCAEKAFLVINKGKTIVPWPKMDSNEKKRISGIKL